MAASCGMTHTSDVARRRRQAPRFEFVAAVVFRRRQDHGGLRRGAGIWLAIGCVDHWGAWMTSEKTDLLMMAHCLGLSKAAGKVGEYPYAAVICRDNVIVAEATNRVARDGDVTRHAEVVAISQAQHVLGSVSLDDCEIYTNAEPCVFCSYAIRESRIRRVVFGLGSPHMGGLSKWNVLGDTDLSASMPECNDTGVAHSAWGDAWEDS